MNQESVQTPVAGGFSTRLPQNPQDASAAQNLCVDPDTNGWSTRVGYELFKAGSTTYAPFSSTGPVYSIHAAQHLAGGARQHILYEDSGELNLAYDASGQLIVRTLASGRNVPAPTELGSWYTDTAYGTVVTNGVDRPVIVKPWPLGDASESSSTIAQCIRSFGFSNPPQPLDIHRNTPFPTPPIASPNAVGGGATTLWCPANPSAIADGGRWGLGFHTNTAAAPGFESLYGWTVSFISDTGSEGPTSSLSTIAWELEAGAEGFRHAVVLEVPKGPPGTVARKLYRTSNFSEDYTPASGDSTLYFLDLIRNNVDTQYVDSIRTSSFGLPAPVVATGPLPAPRARFSALYSGCLFLDGGIDDSRTLYYSAPGLIEQFEALAYIELSGQGGGITALYGDYTNLLVFRENGIDVVRGNYIEGFTVSTISNSVTCRSPKSIQAIPGLGVIFLALDGVYALTGGLEGGAVNDLVNLTLQLDGLIERITQDCFVKAVSAYSSEKREYHLYVPVDGNDRPNLGLVLHVDRLAAGNGLSPWTTRVGFPVGDITTLYNGDLLFGHNTGDESTDNDDQRGLYVISSRRTLGPVVENDVLVDSVPPTSIYRSAWNDFGDPQTLKQVSYVTLWVMTTGKPEIAMKHYKDFILTPTAERTYVAQPPDQLPLPVFDTQVLGTGTYQTERLVPLRFSVAQQSCAWFAFEIETVEDLVLVGYELGYTSKGTQVVMGVRA